MAMQPPVTSKGSAGRSRTAPARPRLVDVAAASGVTVSIASRVLNGDPTVSARPETRERIFAAARKLSYIPSALARSLRSSRTMTIGMVLPNVAYAVNAEIIRGAERRAAAEGYVVLIADAEEFGPAGAAYERLVMEGRVDGLLVASRSAEDGPMRSLSSIPLPVVHVNRRGGKFGVSVSVDDEQGVAIGVDHLVGLGHRAVAHIAGPQQIDTARRRCQGFMTSMRGHGVTVGRGRVTAAPMTEAGGFAAMEVLLAAPRRPTAVSASSFAAAVGAMAAIVQAGLTIPDDISVVAFHDAPIGEFLNPPLTTVRMPLGPMAEAAVSTLRRLIEGEHPDDLVVGDPAPALVKRASTAPHAG